MINKKHPNRPHTRNHTDVSEHIKLYIVLLWKQKSGKTTSTAEAW